MCEGRYRDGGSALYAWAEPEVFVVCPRCASRAVVRRLDEAACRLTCPGCGLARAAAPTTSSWGGPVDPWFGEQLWLQTDVTGHRLWAYNDRHLAELRRYVAATHRERTPTRGAAMSMVEKLPAWLTSAKNRDDVVAALDQLAAIPTGGRRS